MNRTAPAPEVAHIGLPVPPRCPGCGGPIGDMTLLRGHDRMLGSAAEFSVVGCRACRLASTLPRLRPDQFAEYYPDDYNAYRPAEAPDSAGIKKAGTLLDRLRLQAIIRFGPYRPLGRRRPGRMLDVGCSTGDLALTFGREGWSVEGVEPSEAACRYAEAAGLLVHHGTLDDAPWQGPTFDAIVFNHSLEHVPDPAATLRQAASLLREGGMLGVGVPNFGCWQRRLFGNLWYQLDLPRHLQHFDPATLTALMRAAGLRVVECRTSSMRPSILLSLEYAIWGRPRVVGRTFQLAAWAIAPLLLMLDLAGAGDCVHVFAVRDHGAPEQP